MSAAAVADPDYALTPSGNLRQRLLVSRGFVVLACGAAALAVGILGLLVVYVVVQGLSVFSLSFLTSNLPPFAGQTGGVGPALLGSAEVLAIATLIAIPVGVGTAIYLSEYAGRRLSGVFGTFLGLMNGVPTIVTSIFVFGLLVEAHGNSGIADSIALSIIMTPLIARATLESLHVVPSTIREAADALGVARWRAVLTVIVPGVAGSIVTATILAVARAAGETAPPLILNSVYGPNVQLNPLHSVPTIPIEIYELADAGFPGATARAWGMAFVLLVLILLANIGARLLLARSKRRNGL